MWRKIDDYIFDVMPAIQTVANYIEYFSSLHCIKQARLVVMFGLGQFIVLRLSLFRAYDKSQYLQDALIIMFVVPLLLFIARSVEQSVSQSHTKNYFRDFYTMQIMRLLFFLFALWKLASVLLTGVGFSRLIATWAILLFLYLLACDRLPPGNRFWDIFRRRQIAY